MHRAQAHPGRMVLGAMRTQTQTSARPGPSFVRWLALIIGAAIAMTPAVPRAQGATEPLNVIVFWSTTCTYCEPLLAQMETLRRKLASTPARFYSARIDDDEIVVPVAHRQPRYGFEIVSNSNGLALRYEVPAVPWVVITDCEGNVVASPSNDNLPAAVTGYVAMELGFRGYPTRLATRPLPVNARAACVRAPDTDLS